jgi:hypothetical protein
MQDLLVRRQFSLVSDNRTNVNVEDCISQSDTRIALGRPYLLAEWDEMKKLYRGPYIDAFCQAWFHLAQLFQRSRLKYEKVNRTDDRRQSDGNTSHDPLGQVT